MKRGNLKPLVLLACGLVLLTVTHLGMAQYPSPPQYSQNPQQYQQQNPQQYQPNPQNPLPYQQNQQGPQQFSQSRAPYQQNPQNPLPYQQSQQGPQQFSQSRGPYQQNPQNPLPYQRNQQGAQQFSQFRGPYQQNPQQNPVPYQQNQQGAQQFSQFRGPYQQNPQQNPVPYQQNQHPQSAQQYQQGFAQYQQGQQFQPGPANRTAMRPITRFPTGVPGAGAPAGAAGNGALLAAKVNPGLMTEHRRAPVPFAPFTLKDLKDPKTGQPPGPTTILNLPNGKSVPAERYLVAINNLEQKLDSWGYTLRGPQQRVVLNQLNVNRARLQQEAAKPLPFLRGNARTEALMSSPAILQQEHAAAAQALRAAPQGALQTAPQGGPQANQPAMRAFRPPLGGITALQPVTVTKNFDDHWGDDSIFSADVNGSLTFQGTATSASVSGQAVANCSILGNTESLLLATADLTAPRAGGLSAKVKVTTLGVDQVVLDQTEPADWTKTDTFSRSLPDSFKVSYNTAIGPIPVSVLLGARGSLTMPYFVGLLPGRSTTWMIPNVQSSVYGQAGIGIDISDTGIVAGVEANFTLLNNKLTMLAEGDQGSDTKGTFLNYSIITRDDVDALEGSVSAFVEAEVLGYGAKIYDQEIFSFGGIKQTFTPLFEGATVYLQPALQFSPTLR